MIRSDEECYEDYYLYESADWQDEDEVDDEDDDLEFANLGSNSSLRAATRFNPRIHPCPECGTSNVLTTKDVRLGYRCDSCADRAERGGY